MTPSRTYQTFAWVRQSKTLFRVPECRVQKRFIHRVSSSLNEHAPDNQRLPSNAIGQGSGDDLTGTPK
jgi:hypothetical protein